MSSSKIMRNYLYNTIYQVILLITPLITTPYVSRVLGAEGIGIYHYAQSYVTYFMMIGALGTGLYGQREIAYVQTDVKAYTRVFKEIVAIRMTLSLIGSIVFYFVFCLSGEYSFVYRVLIIELLATGIDISWFYTGLENFKRVVIRNIIIRIVCIVSIFIFVKSEKDVIIYTICLTLPAFAGNISLWFGVRKLLDHTHEGLSMLFDGIKKRIRPIIGLFIPQIAIEVYTVLDKTMIGILGTDISQVGYYTQGQKLIKIVMMIITSLGTVMLPAMAALYSQGDKERIKQSIIKAFRFMIMMAMALIFGLIGIVYRFVPVFYGDGYDPVAILIIIISPIIFIIGASNILGKQYLLPTKQQTVFTISVVSGASVNFLLNMLLIPRLNAVGASIATVIAELTVTGIQCWYVRKEIPLIQCFKPLVKYLPLGILMCIIVRIIGCCVENNMIALITMIFAGAFVYIGVLFGTKDPMIQTGISFVNRKK